ncbi:MAG: hypothetical protein ACXW29_03780, partial [Thermoanaerobaculia bacterium]
MRIARMVSAAFPIVANIPAAAPPGTAVPGPPPRRSRGLRHEEFLIPGAANRFRVAILKDDRLRRGGIELIDEWSAGSGAK